jgi:hypothetical protein
MEFPKLMVLDAGEYRPVSHLTQVLIEDMAKSDPDVGPEDFTRVMKTSDFQEMLMDLEQEIGDRVDSSITQKVMNIVDFMADKLSDDEGN